MRILITGAGQIGAEIARRARIDGHEAVVVCRTPREVEGARVVVGDAGDPALLARETAQADAVAHCIHAAYDPEAWRRELPRREEAVMDAAAAHDIPVVFPESVYAFGRAAEDLVEGAPLEPCSPLGEVRAELLSARAAHLARTVSVVASDLVGAAASPVASLPLTTVVRPAARGRTPWVLADPEAPHALTDVGDLARAMLHVVAAWDDPALDRVVHAPTGPARSLQDLAAATARCAGERSRRARAVPRAAVRLGSVAGGMLRSLAQQDYLWRAPCRVRPGRLADEGLAPLPWDRLVEGSIAAVR
ncbi:NAD-dependent epimerase/dehydratase family protein [Brachybacterium huguangmaarense]